MNFKKLFQLLLSFIIEIVLLTEAGCQLIGCVTLVDDDSFLFAASQIDVDKQKRLLLFLHGQLSKSL